MKKTNNIFYIVVFFVIFAITGLLSELHAPMKVSYLENRTLSTIPVFSFKGYKDGTYQKKLEEGMKDQSYIRKPAVRVSVLVDAIMGRRDRNGTYFNDKGTYVKMETANSYSDSRLSLNTRILKVFAEKTGKTLDLCLIPPKGSAEQDQLPAFAPYLDYDHMTRQVWKDIRGDKRMNLISLEAFFDQKQEKYFDTDHHYNSMGAYFAARSYQRSRGLDLMDYDYYSPVTVGSNFRGSLYKKAPLYDAKYDNIETPSKVPELSAVYRYGYDGRLGRIKRSKSIYEPEYLFTSDKYSVYMGGNHGLAVITNKDVKTGPVLLMIKDSYANSAVPYLCGSYKRIVLIDLRYYGGKSLLSEIRKQAPDRIVVWYEMLDYATESRFASLLR
ncbi:MAG: DHHW family protein [Lachnospiraceae bacterium]|nr:DHHW family protein [Lachnospiraceae bacterium]